MRRGWRGRKLLLWLRKGDEGEMAVPTWNRFRWIISLRACTGKELA